MKKEGVEPDSKPAEWRWVSLYPRTMQTQKGWLKTVTSDIYEPCKRGIRTLFQACGLEVGFSVPSDYANTKGMAEDRHVRYL